MLDILKYIFSDFRVFCGVCLLILLIGGITVDIIRAWKHRGR